MMSAIVASPVIGKLRGRLRLFERVLQHIQHHFQRFHPDLPATNGTEMLDPVPGRAISPRKCEMDEAFLVARPARARKASDAEREVRIRAGERPLRHSPGNDLGDGSVVVEKPAVDAEKLRFRGLAIGNETALEPVACAFDVGQQRGEHSSGAALRSRDRQLAAADLVPQAVCLLVSLIPALPSGGLRPALAPAVPLGLYALRRWRHARLEIRWPWTSSASRVN